MSADHQKTIFQKTYDGNSAVDFYADVEEAMDNQADLPKDEHGFLKGKLTVLITWTPEQ